MKTVAIDVVKRIEKEMDTDIMTLDEVASYLRVSERTVYDWVQRGELPGGKIGTSWRFRRCEVDHWVDRRLGSGAWRKNVPVSIASALVPERCTVVSLDTKQAVLEHLVCLIASAPEVGSKDVLAEAVMRREALMSTGIGSGLAVPHVRHQSISNAVMAVTVSGTDLKDYDSLDGKPVRIVAMIAAAQGQHTQHIQLLAALSRKIRESSIRRKLLRASDGEEIYQTLVIG